MRENKCVPASVFLVNANFPFGFLATDLIKFFPRRGQAVLLSFPDHQRVVAIGPSARILQQELKSLTDKPLLEDIFLEDYDAIWGLLELASPANYDCFHKALADAEECGIVLDFRLEKLLEAALRLSSQITDPWDLSRVDISTLVCRLTREIHGEIRRAQALVVGCGSFSKNLINDLSKAGLTNVTAVARDVTEAEKFAISIGGHFVPFESLDFSVQEADIVITDIGDGRITLKTETIARALRARKFSPILLIDGGIPCDIAPGVDSLENAYLFSCDDLERMIFSAPNKGSLKTNTEHQILSALGKYLDVTVSDDITRLASEIGQKLGASLQAPELEVFQDRLRIRLAAIAAGSDELPAEISQVLELVFLNGRNRSPGIKGRRRIAYDQV